MVKSESLPSRDEDMSALGQEPKAAMDAYAAIGKGYESGTMLYAVLCFEKVAAA